MIGREAAHNLTRWLLWIAALLFALAAVLYGKTQYIVLCALFGGLAIGYVYVVNWLWERKQR